MWLSVGLSLAVCALWLFSYHHIFDMTFDESYARASGSSVTLFNTLAAVVVAVVIVISMRLVGTLLVSSLLVVPAIAAMKVAKSFRAVCIVAAVFTVVCSLAGILVSVVAGTPVGSTIVAADIVAFLFMSGIGRIVR
jgi:zinc transport system permease protein